MTKMSTSDLTGKMTGEGVLSWPDRLWHRCRWWLGEAATRDGRSRLLERSGFQGAYFHSWMFPITRHGKLLLSAFAFTALPAGISVDVPMYEVTVGVVCLLVVTTGVGSWYRLAKTTISGGFPATVVAGETLVGRVRFENRSRVSLFDIGVGCFAPPGVFRIVADESVHARIPPGESIEVSLGMRADGRGRFRVPPVRAYTVFPFVIGRTELARLPWSSVLILPRIPDVSISESIAPPGMAEDQSQLRRGRADATEYLGGREYVPGDEPRLIDHRAWARTGRLIVREWGVPAHRGRMVILDGRLPERLPSPWPGLTRVIHPEPPECSSIWPSLRPLFRTLWGWIQRGEATLEHLFQKLALRRYGRLAGDAAAGLVAGMLFQWSSRHEPCELVCGGDVVRWFELEPGRDAFDSAWEYLGEVTFSTQARREQLLESVAESLSQRTRTIWVVTCDPEDGLQAMIARLRGLGHDVRAIVAGVEGTPVPAGFTLVPLAAIRGGAVRLESCLG